MNRAVYRSAVLGLFLLLAVTSSQATTIHTKSTGSYGMDSDQSAWNLSSSSPLVSSGAPISGSQEIVCPSIDLSGGVCMSGVYDFLYQIDSAPANLILTFTDLSTSGADFDLGIMVCGPPAQNSVALCTNTTAANAQSLGITDSFTSDSATFNIPGALPTFPAGINGEGNLTFYLVLDDTSGVPTAPTLTASVPEPTVSVLLVVGLLLLFGFSRPFRKFGKIASAA